MLNHRKWRSPAVQTELWGMLSGDLNTHLGRERISKWSSVACFWETVEHAFRQGENFVGSL